MQPTNMKNLIIVEEVIEAHNKTEGKFNSKKKRKLAFWRKVTFVYNPFMAIIFVSFYWVIGLKHAEII